MIFYTNATRHFAARIGLREGERSIGRFSDGEIHVRVEEEVRGKGVWVLAATGPPAENLLEPFFLADALSRQGAEVNLLFTYFGYARQDRERPGEALSSKVVCDWLKALPISRTVVIHMHSRRIRNFLDYEDVLPVELFQPILEEMEVFLAPDRGAHDFVKALSVRYDRRFALMEKVRPRQEEVRAVSIQNGVEGKRVLIVDDMISTGETVLQASARLLEEGAREVRVAATHGLFAKDAVERIEESAIKKVYVTNSVRQSFGSNKIETIDLSPVLAKVVGVERQRD